MAPDSPAGRCRPGANRRPRRRLGPEFGKLWLASTVSNLGDGVTLVAGPLLAATLTRDPVLVAGIVFAQRLPWLLFALVSGALADRLDRRRLMVSVDAFRCVAIGLLGVAVLADAASISLLWAVFFVLGTAETLFDTAALAVLPAVVQKSDLARANSRLMGANTVANLLAAPPLGGFLFATAAAVPFLLDAGTFAFAAALLLALRGNFRAAGGGAATAAPTTLRSEIAEGVRWILRHRLLRTLAITIGVLNVTFMSAVSILVLVAQERLGLGPVAYGVLLSTVAVGGIAGSLTAERIIARLGPGTTMRAGMVVEASTHLVLALTRSPLVAGAILTLFGLHALVWSVISTSLRQELLPDRLRGRVNSAYLVLSAGGNSLGGLLGGVLAKTLGLTAPYWFGLVGVVILTALIWPVLNNRTISAAREAAAAS